jgi:hypothetical protein
MKSNFKYDCLIIGGGLYGSYLASLLSRNKKVLLIDKNVSLMRKASFANQTRIHEGTHYLKSMETAFASKIYSDKLKKAFPEIIVENSEHFYVVPDEYNAISKEEFLEKCELLSVTVNKVERKILSIPHNVYNIIEDNYDPSILRNSIIKKFNSRNLEIKLSTYVTGVVRKENEFVITLNDNSKIITRNVYNSTYASINELNQLFSLPLMNTVSEFVEIPLIFHEKFSKKALTIIDGPYLSLTPFGSSKLHNLTSVIYSHHSVSSSAKNRETYINFVLKQFEVMLLPEFQDFSYHGSLLSEKITLLFENSNDARPLVMKKYENYIQILGTKVGNILEMDDLIDE